MDMELDLSGRECMADEPTTSSGGLNGCSWISLPAPFTGKRVAIGGVRYLEHHPEGTWTHILSVGENPPAEWRAKRGIRRIFLPMEDSKNITRDVFTQVYQRFEQELLDALTREGAVIYIHCWAGQSRSPALLGMFLIRQCGWHDPMSVLEYLVAARHSIWPNFTLQGFWEDACHEGENVKTENAT